MTAALDDDRATVRTARARRSVLDSGTVAVADLVRPVDALARRAVPPLPVAPALETVLPDGLRRGSTVAVRGSVSLLLALLGGPSGAGAWCALVGLPSISAEAAVEYGVDLSRLALVPAPGPGWLTAVGALLDAVDIVAVRPPARVTDGDLRRLAARTRGRAAVLMPYLGDGVHWPRADVEVGLSAGQWAGVGSGHGRLRARAVTVTARGRAAAARPRSAQCFLPDPNGGIGTAVSSTGAGALPVLRAG
ncbi:MAG: hypothetical protein ABJA87_09515 [bacterium]